MGFYYMPIDMCFPKFDIYHGKVASNCFKRLGLKNYFQAWQYAIQQNSIWTL